MEEEAVRRAQVSSVQYDLEEEEEEKKRDRRRKREGQMRRRRMRKGGRMRVSTHYDACGLAIQVAKDHNDLGQQLTSLRCSHTLHTVVLC